MSNYTDALTEHKFQVAVRIIGLCPEGAYVASGVIVGPDSMYTAKHAAECTGGTDPIILLATLSDGRDVVMEVAEKSDKHDIALLKALAWAKDVEDGSELGPVKFDNFAALSDVEPKVGLIVCYVGGGADPSVKLEKCGKVAKKADPFEVGIQGRPGNSGGPVFDSRGRVMGVLSKMNLSDQLVYIVPHAHLPL